MAGNVCQRARLAFTGVGPIPVRIPDAEAVVTGKMVTDGVLAELGKLVTHMIDPTGDIHASAEYRKEVAGVLARRAIRAAAERAKTSQTGTRDRGNEGTG